MIIVDTLEAKAGERRNLDLVQMLKRLGLPVEISPLQYGDVAFTGNGPGGPIAIGIERKRMQDMLGCIDDGRYNAQRIGMLETYQKTFLMLEAVWSVGAPPFQAGALIDNAPVSGSWRPVMQGSRRVMYSKLYRYLLSVALSGVIITYSRDVMHSAFNIAECYHYFQKKWKDHTSLLQPHVLAIPDMNMDIHRDPVRWLVKEWASRLDGVGAKLSLESAGLFKTGFELANADEDDWMSVVSPKVAKGIVRTIRGTR